LGTGHIKFSDAHDVASIIPEGSKSKKLKNFDPWKKTKNAFYVL